MFPTITKGLHRLSLTTQPTPIPTVRHATSLLLGLSHDADLSPSSSAPSSVFNFLADLLSRRATIFSQHRKVLSGKETHYAGMEVAEARELWEEVEGKVGQLMNWYVERGVFSKEQVGELKEMVCPHFAWEGLF